MAEDQQDKAAEQLAGILAYVDQLKNAGIDESVVPFFGAIEPVSMSDNHVRQDSVQPSRPREQVLGNAPRHDQEHYLVPPVFEDGAGA